MGVVTDVDRATRSSQHYSGKCAHDFAMPLEKLISPRYNIFKVVSLIFIVTFYIKEIVFSLVNCIRCGNLFSHVI